jgi:hypothetical protein
MAVNVPVTEPSRLSLFVNADTTKYCLSIRLIQIISIKYFEQKKLTIKQTFTIYIYIYIYIYLCLKRKTDKSLHWHDVIKFANI